MRSRQPSLFRFPHFARTSDPDKQSNHQSRRAVERDTQFLSTQLDAANSDNSTLRQTLTDVRDKHAQQVHTLRQQKSSLEARIIALTSENDSLKSDVTFSTKQKSQRQFDTTALRAEAESLKRRLSDAERSTDIIKSAMKELTQELTALAAMRAAANHELDIVRRERDAALDEACHVQNILERERTEHEFKQAALRKEIIYMRNEQRSRTPKSASKSTPNMARTPAKTGKEELEEELNDNENPLATDSLSTEILTPRPESEYHVLFNPQIPMTPIRALDDSEYVVNGHGFDSIRESAFATVEFGEAKLNFEMVLNEPFSAWGSAERPTMMYIGFEYPDGTSLCYAPLRDVRVKYASSRDPLDSPSKSHALGADYGRDYVQLCLHEEMYIALVARAKEVFVTQYSPENVDLPRVSYEKSSRSRSRTVLLTASMKPDARIESKVQYNKHKHLLSKELLDKREDIVGDALMAMRFSKAYPNDSGYRLGFKLHGMFVGPR